MIPPVHVRFFTRRSLRTVLGRHGFTLLKLHTTGTFGDDVSAWYRWQLKRRGLQSVVGSRAEQIARIAFARIGPMPLDHVLARLGQHQGYMAVYVRAAG